MTPQAENLYKASVPPVSESVIWCVSPYWQQGPIAADKFEPVGFKLPLGLKDNRLLPILRQTLALPTAYEGSEQAGYLSGETILMLKTNKSVLKPLK